jgi:ABC-type glycerol-3-phosphate transport system substrate-binding protein
VGNPEVAFSQKLAAIIFRESWFVGWLKTNSPDIKYRVYPLPAMKVAPGAGALFPWADMVYANSPNKKLAWEFMKFMWTKEIDLEKNMKQGIMPVWKANLESPYVKARADYQAVLEMVKRKPAPAYYNPKANEVATAYGDAILDVIYARKNAKGALTEAAMRIERMLK